MLRILLVIVALSAGGAAAWMALAFKGNPSIVHTSTPAPMQDVLVATADVAQGEALTEKNMKWQAWPENALNPTYLKRSMRPDALERLAGSIVRYRIVSGEPIGEDKLASRNSGLLATMLPPGKRAVAVRVSAESAAGGFILPNDRVDILHTIEVGEQKERVSQAILRNIMVLAIDQVVDENSKDNKGNAKAAVIGKTATLELDKFQTEILTAAQAKGIISLALRSAADKAEEIIVDRPQVSEPVQVSRTVVIRGGRRTIESPAGGNGS
jgi:pilus assembly protein CpaB